MLSREVVIPVAFSLDDGYIVPTIVAIHSVLKSTSDAKIALLILSKGLKDENRALINSEAEKFENLESVRFAEIDNTFENENTERHVTVSAFYRLQIPWLFPEYNKVIYLDGDTIVLKSLRSLFHAELTDNEWVGGVVSPGYVLNSYFSNHFQKYNFDKTKYICSGVILINCKRWREVNLYNSFRSHLGKNYEFQDQDILNMVCRNQIRYLPLKYNFTAAYYDSLLANMNVYSRSLGLDAEAVREDILNPVVIHYNSMNKPWKSLCRLSRHWWNMYSECVCFDPSFECKVTDEFLSSCVPMRLSSWGYFKNFIGSILCKFGLFK